MGLDPTLYGNIRSQQFQLDPLPTLSRAYHAVLQEERLRAPKEPILDVSDVAAFAMPATAKSSVDWRSLRDKERGERRQLFCTYCDTRGHTVASCYLKLQRFPDWWGDRPRTLADYRRARAAGGRGSVLASGGSVPSSGSGSVSHGAGAVSTAPLSVLEEGSHLDHSVMGESPCATDTGICHEVIPENEPTHTETETDDTISISPEVLGRGHRLKFPNSRLQDYVLGTTQGPSLSPSSPRSPSSPSVERIDRLVYVRSLNSRYIPETGNVIVGRIVERRRTADDALNMRNIFQENDVIAVEVGGVHDNHIAQLQVRSHKHGKV
ncbi:hypothetical protein KSS87_022376, partial [Heliosperma pusillum]